MENQLRELLDRFHDIYGVQEVLQKPIPLQFQPNKHIRPVPLKKEHGVYLFFRNQDWLRIGQTGYSQRFTSQHYGTKRAKSTFAADVWANRDEFGFNGEEDQLGPWIMGNIGRANIRISTEVASANAISVLLETFLHLHLKPRFEGRRKM